MRLFVAVWPPPDAVDLLAALPRPDRPGLRWTTPDQWHVTLRFLGEVEDPAVAAQALDAVRSATPEAVLGPAVDVLGGHVLVVPVAGLDEVAGAVAAATGAVGEPPEERPFRGHVTLARTRRGARVRPRPLAGAPVAARWPVGEVTLVRSHLSPKGARYEVVHRVPLDRPDGA